MSKRGFPDTSPAVGQKNSPPDETNVVNKLVDIESTEPRDSIHVDTMTQLQRNNRTSMGSSSADDVQNQSFCLSDRNAAPDQTSSVLCVFFTTLADGSSKISRGLEPYTEIFSHILILPLRVVRWYLACEGNQTCKLVVFYLVYNSK